MSDPADPFDWSGGHPALDLVNSLDERPSASPIEHLASYPDLLRFAELARLIPPALAGQLGKVEAPDCRRIAARARRLREHLHELLVAGCAGGPAPEPHLDAITSAVHAAHAARGLVPSLAGAGLVRHGWTRPQAPEIPLHACALAIEHLLIEIDLATIRKCAAADCGVFYIDTSKGHRRQWCSMRNCGNREKQRRWRARVK
jgi:predicted RNA-binding Zn ribbon-like protein